MSDMHPGALSLEDVQPTIDNPPIQQAPPEPEATVTADAEADPEPEGVVEHAGQRMVPVSVLAAERKRAREAAERAVREKELSPLQAKAQEADQLRQALAETQPYINYLRQHPELLQPPKPTPLEDQIPDDRAERYARRFELYDGATGKPDIARAKAILAEQQQEIQHVATQAAQAAVGPITSQNAEQASKQNFVNMALERDANNQPLVDPKALAEYWTQLPPELTQHPEVAMLVRDAAIGKSLRTTGRMVRPERAPVVSEPAGGRSGPQWQMNELARKIAQAAGMNDKAFSDGAKTYVPGQVNVIGE